MGLSKQEHFSGLFGVYRHAAGLLKPEFEKGVKSANIRKLVMDSLPEGVNPSRLEKAGAAAGVLPEKEEKLKLWLSAPLITLLALSSELGLKALIAPEKLKLIHPLDRLFTLLDTATQRNLEAYVCATMNIQSLIFTESLKKIANAFEEWRYLEKKVGKNTPASGQVSADFQFLETFNDAIHLELVRLSN